MLVPPQVDNMHQWGVQKKNEQKEKRREGKKKGYYRAVDYHHFLNPGFKPSLGFSNTYYIFLSDQYPVPKGFTYERMNRLQENRSQVPIVRSLRKFD